MSTLKERLQRILDLVISAEEGIFSNAWVDLLVECPNCEHEFTTEEHINPNDLDMIVDFRPNIKAALEELTSLISELEVGYHECKKTGEWKLKNEDNNCRIS